MGQSVDRGQCVDIPRTRSPFGNSHITPAGVDEQTGLDRFWFSCWNHASGCVGALVREDGEEKVFRFDPKQGEFGFYSVQYGGHDDLWLCGFLDEVVHLDLITGEKVHYQTGLPHALCSSGMQLDEQSGKLFASTYCQNDLTRKAFIFDIYQKKVLKTFEDLPLKNNQMRHCVPLPDGRYLFIYCVPGLELIAWDPMDDSVKVLLESVPVPEYLSYLHVVMREDGCVYIPRYGWFDSSTCTFRQEPLAPTEATWFAICGRTVYGVEDVHDNAVLRSWNLETNIVSPIYEIPNGNCYSCVKLKDGRFMIINGYCYFGIFDPNTKSLSHCKRLPMDSVGFLDCIYRANEKTLIATPFISQRFLKIDLETGRGYDMGRANNGGGEVLQVTGLNGKVYMACYTEGQLSEYDPELATGYPENPMVVAMPGHEALRPVSMCSNEREIFYANSREYGMTGSVLVAFDTQSGEHRVAVNPVGERILRTLHWDAQDECLIAGSTCEADCRSAKPEEEICVFAKIDVKTLQVIACCDTPEGTYLAAVLGSVGHGKYLVSCISECAHNPTLEIEGKRWTKLFVLDTKTMSLQECFAEEQMLYTPENVFFTGKEGLFVLRSGDVFSLVRWDNAFIVLHEIAACKNCIKVHVQDHELYLVSGEKIYIHTLEKP